MVSPFGLAIISYAFFLFACLIPPSVYSHYMMAPDLMFLDAGTILFYTLCVVGFLVGALLMSWPFPSPFVERKFRTRISPPLFLLAPLALGIAATTATLFFLITYHPEFILLLLAQQGTELKQTLAFEVSSRINLAPLVLTAITWWACWRSFDLRPQGWRNRLVNCVLVAAVSVIVTATLMLSRDILIMALSGLAILYVARRIVEKRVSFRFFVAGNATSNPSDTNSGNQQQPAQASAQNPTINPNNPNPNTVRDIAEDVRRYAPEVNWDYAIIQRVNPTDLTCKLVWMSPRKAILEHDEVSNLELQPGDIVTIFSQRDISVPQTERSQYVIVEGEVVRPGVYKLETNETLRSVLERAGGLTPNAYVYGSQLTRQSARDQQKSLDQLATTMEVQIRQSAVSVAASTSPGELPQLLAAQEAIVAQLHSARASGRVALPVKPKDNHVTDFPDMVLEDSDRLSIPQTPSTVSVVGDVYNPGSFIFEPRNTTGAYLDLAGKGKPQSDMHHAFVLRANGVVFAVSNVNGPFTGTKFERIRLYPGDQIVMPYKLPTGAFVRALRDWTQISSQLALTGAALSIVLP